MPHTIVGLFRTDADVQRVVDDLEKHDFPRTGITLHDEADARLQSWLAAQGVPEGEAEDYIDGVRNGGRLVTFEASDDRTPDAVEIMRRHEHALDAAGAATAAAAGTMGAADADRDRADRDRAGTGRTNAEADATLEVTQEELDVGKREVERGGVRVRTYVTEQPVEEEVRVRDETLHVERRPVDREVREGDDAFRERSVEMTETDEEVVVGKRARVIEEIVLSKEVEERTETVRDTVRRTDVEVEGADDAATRGGYAFDDDREHFRTHHRDTFAAGGYGYEDYEPAYRYGTDLAHHPEYGGQEWSALSPTAREHWQRQNPDTWGDFEPAIRYGYERARGSGRR